MRTIRQGVAGEWLAEVPVDMELGILMEKQRDLGYI